MNNLEKNLPESNLKQGYIRGYLSSLTEALSNLDHKGIEKVIGVLENARNDGKTVFFIGNGGSAGTCLHFAEDLAYGKEGEKHLKAISLTGNVAYITAIGNDEGYEYIFVRQLKSLFNKGDVVLGISASGNSANIIKAVEFANNNQGVSIGLVGFDGGRMKGICQHCIHIKTKSGEYGPVEDIHLVLAHIISMCLKGAY